MKTIHKISGIFLWCVVGVFLGKSGGSDCGDAGGSGGDSKKNEEGIEGDDF